MNRLTFTEKGNILIAEFIGLEHPKRISHYNIKCGWDGLDFNMNNWWVKNSMDIYLSEALEYHSSWGWLMPVVERIESLGYIVTIRGDSTFIDIPGCEDFGATQKTKIGSTWLAVVEFIKWYNINILKHDNAN